MLDKAFEQVVAGMEQMDSEDRITLLESIGRLHGMSLTLFTLLEAVDHKDHEAHECGLKYPKDIVEGYFSAFRKDVDASIEMTCVANGFEYAPDPNKEVRDEILAESDS